MEKDHSDNNKKAVKQLQEKPSPDEFLIVGIGASAGGIQALQQFFRAVPLDSGMAYVVILHLSPDHDSQLAAVLQRETNLSVSQVTGKESIRPDHIYVVPPNRHLTMEDGVIVVSENITLEDRRAPVDIFFRTLADVHGPRAIAVILSGTGANGSMGLKRIKERGGACFVQNPREAEFNEMPRNAIATEMVDEILQVADIPVKIISYKASLASVAITDDAEMRPEDEKEALREVFTQIRVRTGHDFSNYKRPTLLRRIERRINIRDLPDLPSYAKYLQEQPEEPAALLKDLLISVTNFFRDKKPFEMIEQEIIPLLFKGKTNEDHVRIWVAGCATGEEAYSIAMLCLEKAMGIIDAPKVQIFATDIDESALAHAREGLYSLNDAADVSTERIRRFFNKEGDNYRVRREIREMILFATHNFLKDPPFSRLDMVTCRNVMIYLNQVAQERIIDTFHFALNPGGFLFLGTSESVDGSSDLYATYNRENHVYQSRQVKPRAYPVPESTPAIYFEQVRKDRSQENEHKILQRISAGDLHQQLLEEYAAPSIVINEDHDILHLTERAGKYLQIGGGELSQGLLKLVKPELRLELRSALYQAMQRKSAVEARGIKVNVDDKIETVNIKVRPVMRSGDTAKGFILVLFEPTADEHSKEVLLSADEPVSKHLEEELVRVKGQLRAANEQHDFQAEEMKASNEELQAMNEELRSAAEELETSKEELQSINEELRTVNQELKVKIEEISIASNNLQNIINATDIGTIFLDRSFRVALFTPAAGAIFNLIPADVGRPLTDITHKLEYQSILSDAESVLENLNSIEREVRTADRKFYLMRLRPYRTDEDRIKGIVVTFIDITERKKADEAMRISEEKYRTLFNSIDEGFSLLELIFDEKGKVIDYWHVDDNPSFARMTGIKDSKNKRMSELVPNLEAEWYEAIEKVFYTGQPIRIEYPVIHLDQWYSCYLSRVGIDGVSLIAAVYDDITERKQAEKRQAFMLKLSDAIRHLKNAEEIQAAAIQMLGQYLNVNRAYYAEALSDGDTLITRSDYVKDVASLAGSMKTSDVDPRLRQLYSEGKTLVINNVLEDPRLSEDVRSSLHSIQFSAGIAVPLLKQKQLLAVVTVQQSSPRRWTRDEINLLEETAERTWAAVERAKAETAVRNSEERLQRMVNVPRVGVITFDYSGSLLHANDAFIEMVGYTRAEFSEQQFTWRDFTPPQHIEASLQILQQIKETRRGGPYEKQYIHKDGSLLWLMFVAADLGDGTIVEYAIDVSERRLMEEALRKSELRLQMATDAANMGTFVYYPAEDIGEPDTQMLTLFGLPEDRTLTLREALTNLIHPEDRERYASDVTEALDPAGSGKLDADIRVIHPDQTLHWIHISAQTYFEGEPVYAAKMSGVAIDITERKIAEDALQQSEERLRVTMESAVDYAIITLNTKGIIAAWSSGAERIFGYTGAEAIGQHIEIIFTTKDREHRIADVEMKTAREKGSAPDERWHIRKNGSKFYMSGVLSTIDDGRLLGYVKVARDMTEQKQAEEQLRLFEERNRVALQSAEMGAWDWNIIQDRIIWNEQHYLLFGLEPESAEKNRIDFLKFVHPDDRQGIEKKLVDAVEKDGIFKTEFRIIRADNNQVRWMSGFGRAIQWEENKAGRMVGVMFDITDRKKLEQQKEDFIGIASHELKTPVTSIKAYAELLHEMLNDAGDPATAGLMKKLDVQIDRLIDLIHALLDTSKIADGPLPIKPEAFDLKALMEERVVDLQRLSNIHRLEIDSSKNVVVYADKERIGEVLTNLISNGIKYSPKGGKIAIDWQRTGGTIQVSVRDEGIGISEDAQLKVFDRFFRETNTKNHGFPGMGLGLYISANIIRQHEGTIWVESKPGEGSTFYFTLPIIEN